MSVLRLNVCRLCLPNVISLGVCLKKLHLIKVGAFAWYSVIIRVIFGVRFERRKVDKKKQTYMKTEACNLYSRAHWTFKPNFIKIDRYNFKLNRFKVGSFFEAQCTAFSCVICAAVLIGRTTRLARPSYRPSVLYGRLSRTLKGAEKPKVVWTFLIGRSNSGMSQFSAQKVEGQSDGRAVNMPAPGRRGFL